MRHEPALHELYSDARWCGPFQRARRHRRESAKAKERLLRLLAADHRARFLGSDPTTVSLAAALGLERHDLVVARVFVGARLTTLIIVPRRLWHHQKTLVLALKTQARALGITALLIPSSQLSKQPRLANAERIATCSTAAITAEERDRLVSWLLQHGSATLLDCAELLPGHPDPVSAALSLVRAGFASVSLDQPLDAGTRLYAGKPT